MHPDELYDEDQASEEDEPSTLREVIVTIVAALVLAYVVQGFLVKPYRIPSGSMENTLKCGDRVLVDRLSYHFGDPSRKDVVVFHPPAALDENGRPDPATIAGEGGAAAPRNAQGVRNVSKADVNYIKRLIGMPGDKVEVRDNHVIIDGKPLDEPYLFPLPKTPGISSASMWGPYTVPKGTYLMLGDNRENSADGRFFGFVPREFIVGKAFMVYWPPKRLGGLPAKEAGGPDAAKPDSNCLESIPQDLAADTDG